MRQADSYAASGCQRFRCCLRDLEACELLFCLGSWLHCLTFLHSCSVLACLTTPRTSMWAPLSCRAYDEIRSSDWNWQTLWLKSYRFAVNFLRILWFFLLGVTCLAFCYLALIKHLTSIIYGTSVPDILHWKWKVIEIVLQRSIDKRSCWQVFK